MTSSTEGGTPRQISYYRLGRVLGRGGMGTVYEAIDTRNEITVALKLLHEHLEADDSYRERFQREAHVAALLRSPYTVHLLDYGIEDDRYFLVMKFAAGESLRERLERGPLAPATAFAIAAQIARALEKAEARGVVHRDIKPDNVLISHDGETKLLDFGLARILDEGFGDQSVLAGTPFYMAPEQIDGSVVDHRADIYALGVILFRMFTGRLPFTEGNIFVAHALEPVPDPLQFDPTMPQGVVDVINRCMEKKPDQRYDNCGLINLAIRQALLDDLSSEPPADQTPS